ncbi:hypothetical protein H8959_008317 [Pygathrix nigripes]
MLLALIKQMKEKNTHPRPSAARTAMEVLESGEQGVLQWDRKLSELSEPGDGEALMYHTPYGMCSVWATLPVIKAVTVERKKPALQFLDLSFSCQKKESVLKIGFPTWTLPTPPTPFCELSGLLKKIHFYFLQLLFLHCK